MFTREDYLNLAAVLSMAHVEGIAQASWLVVTHDKLTKIAEEMERPVKQFPEDEVKLTEE